MTEPDFLLQDEGSILLLRPCTDAALAWIDEHVSAEGYQPYWPTVLMERRYVANILDGIDADGLVAR